MEQPVQISGEIFEWNILEPEHSRQDPHSGRVVQTPEVGTGLMKTTFTLFKLWYTFNEL